MKIKKLISPGIVLVCVLTTMVLSFTAKKNLPIDGAWSIVEVQTVKPDGSYTSVFPKESQAMFAKKHYSFCWTTHTAATRTWQIPDSVKLLRFNQSIINTGSFELKDSILTTKATFAMSPMFVNGLATFKCTFVGDTLLLTGLSVVSAEQIPHPVYANGAHIVTKLLKISSK